jgi:uncharacterized protein YqjF (DUF2071 family)
MFRDTRVLGVPVPFHRTFEEVNLRMLRSAGRWVGEVRRGVVFVQELVPRWAIATVARVLYQERYRAVRMSHRVDVRRRRHPRRRRGRVSLEHVRQPVSDCGAW